MVINVPEDQIEIESFTVFSIDFSVVYEKKYYVREYPENFLYLKIINKQMIDYVFETDEN